MNYDCLIVDDEIALLESTCEYFNMFDVNTAGVATAQACLQFFESNTTSLILLDINLGNESGFDLCKRLRTITNAPILFISARTSNDDMILALNIGGDDYIQKPYSLAVLLAKVKAVLKRYQSAAAPEEDAFETDNLRIDFSASAVYVNDQKIDLKAMEYKLLAYLAKNANRTVTKDEIFAKVWETTFVGDNTLNVHVRYLREKIEKDPKEPQLIKTVWGVGYVLEANA